MFEKCEHSATDKRRRTLSNGVITVVLQCLDCGSAVRSLPKFGETVETLPEYDPIIKEAKFNAWQEQFQQQREAQSDEFWTSYNAYLNSQHWRNIRRLVLSRDPMCQVCFTKTSEQAHHLTYESFKRHGISFSVECVGVCAACHEFTLHKRDQNV